MGKSARFRVGALSFSTKCRPYPPHYRVAFAYYPFRYLLGRSVSLAIDLLPYADPMRLTLLHWHPLMKCLGVPTSAVALGIVN
jgi:hypothetical protein